MLRTCYRHDLRTKCLSSCGLSSSEWRFLGLLEAVKVGWGQLPKRKSKPQRDESKNFNMRKKVFQLQIALESGVRRTALAAPFCELE
jgi:hypothetical protein